MIDNPEIAVDYSLSYREFVAGQKLAMRTSVFLLLVHVIARYIALFAGVLLVVICVINIAGGHWGLVKPIVPSVFLVFLIPSIFWISWRYSFNRLKLSSDQDPRMTFQAGPDSFSRKIHGMGELTWLWSATQGVLDNAKIVVISVRRGAFLFIPRRALSDAEVARLKELLREGRRKQSC